MTDPIEDDQGGNDETETAKLPTLSVTVGLPRSGKSTLARRICQPIVSRDAIRLALHGKVYLPQAEDMVSVLERVMVEALIKAGHEKITIDACHQNAARRKKWEDGRKAGKWEIEYIILDTPVDECVYRALEDDRPDLLPVIDRMAESADILFEDTNAVRVVDELPMLN